MIRAAPAAGYVPVWTYRLICLVFLGFTAIAASLYQGGYCSTAAYKAVKTQEALNCFEFWLFRYQTLAAGTFALIAAWIGLHAVRSQIAASDRIAQRSMDREAAAARAVLPIALASICDHAEKCADVINSHDESSRYDPIVFPQIPIEPIIFLKEALRWLPSEDKEAYLIVALLSRLQVFSSRYKIGVELGLNMDQAELDVCFLLISAERLFPFARAADAKGRNFNHSELLHAVFALRIDVKEPSALNHALKRTAGDGSGDDDDFIVGETEL